MNLVPPEKNILTVTGFAEHCGVSVRTATAWYQQGVGPTSVMIGGRRFYRREDVNAWIVSNEAHDDGLGVYRAPYEQGHQAASRGQCVSSCPFMCTVGDFGQRTAWIAGWHQFKDEQGEQHGVAA